MDESALEAKYNDKPERSKTRSVLWRWGCVVETCKRNHEEIREYQKLMDEVSELKERSELPVSSGMTADPTGSAVEKLDEMRKEYKRIIKSITKETRQELRLQISVDEQVNQLSPIERRIIHLKYKEKRRNVWIAMKTGMSESHVRRIESEAIDKLSAVIM